jgi:hypothetical protein
MVHEIYNIIRFKRSSQYFFVLNLDSWLLNLFPRFHSFQHGNNFIKLVQLNFI